MKFDDDNTKIEVKNGIDMQDKRIVNIKFPRFGFYDAMGYAFFIE